MQEDPVTFIEQNVLKLSIPNLSFIDQNDREFSFKFYTGVFWWKSDDDNKHSPPDLFAWFPSA